MLSIALSFTALFMTFSVLAGEVGILKDYQDTEPTGAYIAQQIQAGGSVPRISAQLFTASSTYYAVHVDLKLKRVGTPGLFKIGIKAVSAGYPTGDFLAFDYIYGNTLYTNYAYSAFYFNSIYPYLISGTQYAISIEPVGSDSNDNNYLMWRGTIQDLYVNNPIVYDTSPSTLWVTGLHTVTANDLLFRVYGVSANISNTVSVSDYVATRLAVDNKYTAGFVVGINPPAFSTNVTVTLSLSPALTTPISVSLISTDNTSSNFVFDTSTSSLTHPPTGTLAANTIYYYRGKATTGGGVSYYSEIKTFYITSTGVPNKPTISITKIQDVSKLYDSPYTFQVTAKMSSTNTTDPIINQGIDFSLSASSSGILLPNIYSYGVDNVDTDGSYMITLDLGHLAVYAGEKVYFRAYINTNYYGMIYSSTISFSPGTEFVVGGGTNPVTPITVINDMVNKVKTQLGLVGVFGSWAFMGLCLLLVALIFGVAMFSVENEAMKTPLGIIWALISIAIVGAFIFTGELGLWPILILVGGVVSVVLIIASVRLSGGR